jgi:hypothetical protein
MQFHIERTIQEELDSWDVYAQMGLLFTHPEYADFVDWQEFSSMYCSALIQKDLGFEDYIIWENILDEDWIGILKRHEHLLENCHVEHLWPAVQVDLLRFMPDIIERCDPSKFTSLDWATLLSDQIRFARICPWDTLTGQDISILLAKQPRFSDQFDLNKIPTEWWIPLVIKRTAFITVRECPLDCFHDGHWRELVSAHPNLIKYKPFKEGK